MVETNAVPPKCRNRGGILIAISGGGDGFSRSARAFDGLDTFIIGNNLRSDFIKAALSWLGFGADIDHKKHIVAAFLNDADLIQLTVPDQLENGAVLQQFADLTGRRHAVDGQTLSVNIGGNIEPSTGFVNGLFNGGAATERIFQHIDPVIQQINGLLAAQRADDLLAYIVQLCDAASRDRINR